MPKIELENLPKRHVPKREQQRWSNKIATPVEAFFFRHRKKLILVHGFMFVFFVVALAVPLYLDIPTENDTPWNNFTLFANYAMWGLWFPLVFLSVVFTGRSWCGILCPMGAATEIANKKGLKLKIPLWLQWEGTPIVSFLLVTIWGQTLGVRDHPFSMAVVFGGTMALAIVVGYVYGRSKRAWCRHMCPIGLLLGIFSRLGAVQFTPKRKKSGGDIYTEKTACPIMIDLPHKEESRHCIECFRCVNPQAKGGLYMRLRHPGEEIEKIRSHNPGLAEIWFFFLGTGIALGGFLWLVLPQFQIWRQQIGAWMVNKEWWWVLESGPSWLMVVEPERREVFYWLDFMMIVGFMLGFMVLLASILFATTYASSYLSKKLSSTSESISIRFKELGYQYAPVAMVSLIIGLGAKLFDLLKEIGLSSNMVSNTKVFLFAIGMIWSLWLAHKILQTQGVNLSRRWLAMLPGAVGSLAVGYSWWVAIF
ncbi:MAG: 4Fe-4S binding protein [Candidatus Thioglobus sp.]|jgi:hypothetical protein|nr:4Fe-4S binding protein [Candidatus Thioglobus sp.]